MLRCYLKKESSLYQNYQFSLYLSLDCRYKNLFSLQELLYQRYDISYKYKYQVTKKMSHIKTQEQAQINLINELCRMKNQFNTVEETIILYDLFDSPQKDHVFLHNMHTVAQILIDNQAKVSVEKAKLGKNQYFDKLKIEGSQIKIKNTQFNVEMAPEGQSLLTNIFFYEKEGDTKKRVVVIPIQKDLSDISKLKRQQENLQRENKEMDAKFRAQNLQGEDMKNAQAKWNKEKEEKFRLSCASAKDKHLKMFKIEAFLATVLQKTKNYSICSLVEVTLRRNENIDQIFQQFSKIFSVPKEQTPQIIFYNYDPQDGSAKVANHELVSTRLEIVEIEGKQAGEFKIDKIDCWNSKNFYKPLQVRTQIYKNMQQSDSKAISKVIQDFVDDWNDITVRTASCITTIVKLVNQKLNNQKNLGEKANSSTDLNTSLSEIPNIMKFPEVFQKYIDKSLWFPQGEKLGEFYTDERLGKKIKVEEDSPKIPSSIECLVFISFFYKLVNDFSQTYKKAETESRNDQIVLLQLWKSHLKELYELANSINKTFLNTTQKKTDYYASDMQRFFEFLMFTLDSSEKIKKITGRDIATSTNLKSMFELFKPRRDRLLGFIIANENSIKKNEPIQYYELYLLVIKQNASQDIQNDLEYIELHIHEYKAARIAFQYIHDNQQLVEAIRSYALICLKYQKLNENKRKLIDIMDIERKLARLLKIVGQEEYAAQIYFKNREIFFASNCCKQVLSKLKGDQKAKVLIKWGEKFEKQFEYDLANSYYLMAFSYARTPAQKKKALEHKMKLLEKRTKLPNDERTRHDKFIKEDASEESLKEFCSETNLKDMHRKLHKYLQWDSTLQCSGFSKVVNADVDPDCSMLVSESALQKSMVKQSQAIKI